MFGIRLTNDRPTGSCSPQEFVVIEEIAVGRWLGRIAETQFDRRKWLEIVVIVDRPQRLKKLRLDRGSQSYQGKSQNGQFNLVVKAHLSQLPLEAHWTRTGSDRQTETDKIFLAGSIGPDGNSS